jgi:hypothetical protein
VVKSKPFKLIWDKQAIDNFKEILTYLSKKSNQAPGIVKEGVLTELESIKTNALMCGRQAKGTP